jgi:hypothetical protein
MAEQKDNPYLSALYNQISRGDVEILGTLKKLAQTARQIDPSCPYGAHGVLGSLASYGFSPKEMRSFLSLCKGDVRAINAIDYCVYKKMLSISDLKDAVKSGFRGFKSEKYIQFAMRDSTNFSKYYNPKAG